jgi:hypothetical protein
MNPQSASNPRSRDEQAGLPAGAYPISESGRAETSGIVVLHVHTTRLSQDWSVPVNRFSAHTSMGSISMFIYPHPLQAKDDVHGLLNGHLHAGLPLRRISAPWLSACATIVRASSSALATILYINCPAPNSRLL